MNDRPEFTFDVSTADIETAVGRGDYAWLCEHVFTPALAQFQKFADFFKRKSQALHLAYKSQRLYIGIRKLAKTAGAAWRARQ